MARTCNIDAKGKAVRLISGGVTLLVAIALGVATVTGALTGGWWWLIVAAVLAGGAFQVYEGWCGWCIVRALGFKTPI